MKIRTSWPWIAGVVAVAAALNPVGIAAINATVSGEQLARTIGTFLFLAGLGVVVLLALIEFGIRKFLMSRQRSKDMSLTTSGARNG